MHEEYPMDPDALKLLASTPPFDRLPPPAAAAAAAALTRMNFARGTVLAVQGRTTLDYIYVVGSGRLELFFESEGRKVLKGALGRGDVFGAISLIVNAGLSIRTLTVVEDAGLFLMPRNVFRDLCRRHRFIEDHFNAQFDERMQDESYASAIASSQMAHFLARIPPFSFLPEQELAALAPEIRRLFFPGDTRVFVQGESRVDGLYIIQQGAAERFSVDDQQKTLAGVLGEGEMFGGISMLVNDMLAVRSLRTLEDSTFLKLPHQAFFDLCRRHAAFSEFFTDAFGKRMLDRSYAALIAKSRSYSAEPLALLNQPVAGVCSRRLVDCPPELSIRAAAQLMSRNAVSCLL
ncbi:MAG: hypothetical protein EHM15_10585, partial [Desulfobacteraceae bacterium]